MHEYGVTRQILENLVAQLQREQVRRVVSVRFRRASVFSEEILQQSFEAFRPGTPLEHAQLLVDVDLHAVTCPVCGFNSVIDSHDLVGHLFVCPKCAAVQEVEGVHDLELVEVIGETDEPQSEPESPMSI
jgi:Zn finger protein HypA/HybF involved in hydrogenase expression